MLARMRRPAQVRGACDPYIATMTFAMLLFLSAVTKALFTFDEDKNFIPPQRNAALQRLLAEKPKLDVYETAAVGDAADLQRMLREDPAQVSKRNELGWTPLHYAAFAGNTAAIKVLLGNGADIHARATNRFRNTPLIVATLTGQRDAAALLLDSGADILDRQANGFSVMHEASFSGNLELVRLYVERGARSTRAVTTDALRCPKRGAGNTKRWRSFSNRKARLRDQPART